MEARCSGHIFAHSPSFNECVGLGIKLGSGSDGDLLAPVSYATLPWQADRNSSARRSGLRIGSRWTSESLELNLEQLAAELQSQGAPSPLVNRGNDY
jgi:hypothetical protein